MQGNQKAGGERIEDEVRERLKAVLLSIACADVNEVISWAEKSTVEKIRLDSDVALAVSSMKIKASQQGIDCDIKLLDKLKAIELYFKLSGVEASTTDGTLYIDYDYTSPEDKNES